MRSLGRRTVEGWGYNGVSSEEIHRAIALDWRSFSYGERLDRAGAKEAEVT